MFLKNIQSKVSLVYGEISNTGSDLVRSSDSDSIHQYSSRRWIKVGQTQLFSPPESLYLGASDNKVVVAYNVKNKEVIAHWNQTQKKGSWLSPTFLIHPYIWLTLIIWAIFSYQFNWFPEPTQRLLFIIISCAVFTIASAAAFYNWSISKIAHQKIAQFRKNNPNFD